MRVDIGDAESTAVDGWSGTVFSDHNATFLLQDRRFVFIPTEAVGWRVAWHFAPQFDTFTALTGRVAQRFQYPQGTCIIEK